MSNAVHERAATDVGGFGRAIGGALRQIRLRLPAASVRPAAVTMVLAASMLSPGVSAQTAQQMQLGNQARDGGIGAVLGVVGAKLIGAQPLVGAVLGAVGGVALSRPLAVAAEERREAAAFSPPSGDPVGANVGAAVSSALVSATARRMVAQELYMGAQQAEMNAEVAAMNLTHRPGEPALTAEAASTRTEFVAAKAALDSGLRSLNESLASMNRVLTIAERQYPGSALVAASREIYARRLSQQMGVKMTIDHWPSDVRGEVLAQSQSLMRSMPAAGRLSLDSVRGSAPRVAPSADVQRQSWGN